MKKDKNDEDDDGQRQMPIGPRAYRLNCRYEDVFYAATPPNLIVSTKGNTCYIVTSERILIRQMDRPADR